MSLCDSLLHAALVYPFRTLFHRPEVALKLCVCGSRAERLAQSLLSASKRSRTHSAKRASGDEGPDIAMMVNPRMMKDHMNGSDGSSITAEAVESLEDAPSEAQWSQMRGNIASVLRSVKTLAVENAALKRDLEKAQGGIELMGTFAASPATSLAGKSKREFKQMGSGSAALSRVASVRSSELTGPARTNSSVRLLPAPTADSSSGFMSSPNPLAAGEKSSPRVRPRSMPRNGSAVEYDAAVDSPLVHAGVSARGPRAVDTSPLLLAKAEGPPVPK